MRITTRGRKRDLHNQESFHLKVKFQKFKFNFWGGLFMMGGKNVESMQLRNASLPVVKCSNNSDCPYDITCNGSTSQCDCSDILNMGQRDCGMAFVKKCKARFLQDWLNNIYLEIVLSLLRFFFHLNIKLPMVYFIRSKAAFFVGLSNFRLYISVGFHSFSSISI